MSKIYLLFSVITLALTVEGCNNHKEKHPQEVKSSGTVSAAEMKDSSIIQNPNSAALIFAKPEIPILCYHRIGIDRKSEYEVTPSTFEADMKILADSGYHSIMPSQLYDYLVYNKPLPEKPVMITFDDSRAEHFQIAAPVMEKYGFKGVFFIMTITYNKKNYMTTEQIAQLSKAGHCIGLHSWDHVMVTKYKDEFDWKKEVTDPKTKLEKIINAPVEYWAYPDGIYNHRATEELNKYFKLSFSLATPRDSILPLQTIRRMIVPEWTPQNLLKSIHRTFKKPKRLN
jgi:peptidoglycan/xylan/chitin deacetylase (PgdA/CDA1 family)